MRKRISGREKDMPSATVANRRKGKIQDTKCCGLWKVLFKLKGRKGLQEGVSK